MISRQPSESGTRELNCVACDVHAADPPSGEGFEGLLGRSVHRTLRLVVPPERSAHARRFAAERAQQLPTARAEHREPSAMTRLIGLLLPARAHVAAHATRPGQSSASAGRQLQLVRDFGRARNGGAIESPLSSDHLLLTLGQPRQRPLEPYAFLVLDRLVCGVTDRGVVGQAHQSGTVGHDRLVEGHWLLRHRACFQNGSGSTILLPPPVMRRRSLAGREQDRLGAIECTPAFDDVLRQADQPRLVG